MGVYSIIKKEFAFLESEYGFRKHAKEQSAPYFLLGLINEKKI